jgi:hypothetical protein
MILIYAAQALALLIITLLFTLRYPAFRSRSRLINRTCLVFFLLYLALITAGLAEVGGEQSPRWPVVGPLYLAAPGSTPLVR